MLNTDDKSNAILKPNGTRAMVFAAGLGTRLKPFTNHHPKALAEVNGKSLLQRNIEYLQKAGIKEVLVNVHHFADQIIKRVNDNEGWGSNITISNESDEVLETGGGLQKAAWYFKGDAPFVVMNADILTDMPLEHMLLNHQQHQPLATLAVSNRTSSRYFLFDDDDVLCGWCNEATGEQRMARQCTNVHKKAFSGIHVIHPSLLDKITQQGKFSIIDVYLALATIHQIRCFDHSGALFIDVGKPENLEKAATLFN